MASSAAGKRRSGRYWTIAAVSALVALVVAGVTAGTGQHRRCTSPPRESTRRRHHTRGARSGGDTTSPTAPGGRSPARPAPARCLGRPSTRGTRVCHRARWTRHAQSAPHDDRHVAPRAAPRRVPRRRRGDWHTAGPGGTIPSRPSPPASGQRSGAVGSSVTASRTNSGAWCPPPRTDHQRRERSRRHTRPSGELDDLVTTADC